MLLLLALAFVMGPCHWYVWQRVVKDTTLGRRGRIVGAAVLGLLSLSLLVAFSRRAREFLPSKSVIPGYLWIAILLYLVLALLVLEIPRLVVRRRVDPDRRLLIARGAAIFAGLTAGAVVGSGIRTAYGPPVLKRVQIPLARLPRTLDGYRIAVVSDLHLGQLTGVARTRAIVAAVNDMSPDLIAVVGDLVDGDVDELRPQTLPLRDLSARVGAFFVTGNHEYYSGVEQWLAEIPHLGMRVLRNERIDLGGLDLAGVDDVSGGTADYRRALGERDPAKPVVLLAHQPVAVHEAAKYGVDLQLSGHTHGGQIWPFHVVTRLTQPVISGLADVDGTKVYVTNGTGFWGPPVRVGAPPDITLVELRAH